MAVETIIRGKDIHGLGHLISMAKAGDILELVQLY